MILTTYDKGMEVGEAKGRREELREMIVLLASPQCGTPDEDAQSKLGQIQDLSRLRVLAITAAKARTWAELLGND